MNFRSQAAGGSLRADELTEQWLPRLVEKTPVKFYWFLTHGYRPHIYQSLFHGAKGADGNLLPKRHLVAGRRGGKTLSAAWEVLFYALHPSEFHRDAHQIESHRPLWIYALAKDHKVGRPSLVTFLQVINEAGLVKDKDYRFNRQERIFEFNDPVGNLTATVEFRSADDPQSLRGAGLDILWIDEAAFIPSNEAWGVIRPALFDKEGLFITTTTPKGKNWFYEEFWSDEAMADPTQFRVEYTSLDNPHLKREKWEYERDHMHPVLFKQEYMAAFDAMHGVALHGDWLHYWVLGDPEAGSDAIKLPRKKDDSTGQVKFALRTFIGVDPAISVSDDADDFAMALIGLDDKVGQVFLIDYFLGHIAFPDQLDKIREWQLKWRPEYIGIESNAFQAALAQMAARMEGLPNIVPVFAKGKKNERILSMSPLFKTGKVRISERHGEFIDQWVAFDPEKKNQRDDLLDAVEIALGVASILLPSAPSIDLIDDDRPSSLEDEARAQIRAGQGSHLWDPELGIE